MLISWLQVQLLAPSAAMPQWLLISANTPPLCVSACVCVSVLVKLENLSLVHLVWVHSNEAARDTVTTLPANVFLPAVWRVASGRWEASRRRHINGPTSHWSPAQMMGEYKGSSWRVDVGLLQGHRGALDSFK